MSLSVTGLSSSLCMLGSLRRLGSEGRSLISVGSIIGLTKGAQLPRSLSRWPSTRS